MIASSKKNKYLSKKYNLRSLQKLNTLFFRQKVSSILIYFIRYILKAKSLMIFFVYISNNFIN